MKHNAERTNPLAHDAAERSAFWLCVAILAALTAVRLVGLLFSVVDLYVDESQYWAWSREPAFGYFSKPPLLAWIIGMAEAVCGSGEACLRAPAPLFYFATSLVAYAIARALYEDVRVAFFAALMVALTTGTAFSARIISTDVPLIFFWSVALLAYVKLWQGGVSRWSIVLGLALGLGLNAKYAMVYFLLGMALAAVVDAQARALLRRRGLLLGLGIAVILILPNIIWNAQNGFATFKHTGENIEGSGLRLSAAKGFEFIASQFAVFGPVIFGAFLWLAARIGASTTTRADRILLSFSLPVLILVTATAFVTRAHPNWAASAFISATIVVAAFLVRAKAMHWIAVSLAIGLLAQIGLLVADAFADRVSLPLIRKPDVYERTMGWLALGEEVKTLAAREGAMSIASDNRSDVASLSYYVRDTSLPVLAWPSRSTPQNHFELARPLTAAARRPVLFVSSCASTERLSAFDTVRPLGAFSAPTGPTSARRYHAFLLGDPRAVLGLIPPCAG